ncbi:MAG: hypothetical protein AMK71_02430 [Nitrospira bacterium SG8_35_4]|nr:MAG: hypothetical protein AMK71_02430 [Nitrospira bacterium SG8_35_4]
MKILFISVNNEHEPYPVAPLGAAYVASILKNGGHEVSLLDLCFVLDDLEAIKTALHQFRPDLIGISLRNIDNLTFHRSIFYLPRIRTVVDALKKNSSARIIIGGSGYSIFPEEILRYLDLDTGIAGEGENALSSLVDAISSNSTFDDIPNVCTLKNGEFRMNAVQQNHAGCLPDRSLLDNTQYLDLGGMANIQSKRGCPFHCSYCTYPAIEGKKVRLREPGAVADELEEMHALYGIDYVFFVDDIFNYPEEHAVGICEEIIRRDLKIDWTCFATPLGMTEVLAGYMKRAGCRGVEFGSDAVTELTLKGLGKQFTADDIAHAAEACRKADLPNAHYLIIGGPGENDATLEEAFRFFDRIHPTAVITLAGIRIYPGTLLRKRSIDDGVIDKGDSLLEPAFYLSPELNAERMSGRISDAASGRSNWIVPGLNIRCDTESMMFLRRMNRRGPLWSELG